MFSDEAIKAAVEFANKVGGYGGGLPPHEDDLRRAKDIANGDRVLSNRWERILADVFSGELRITKLDEYERMAMSLAFYPGRGTGNLTYPILGLVGEAGEAADHLKKSMRDDGGMTDERKEAIKAELGDTLWYIVASANELGLSLQDIAQGNIKKLFDRASRGKLGGSGDLR